METKEAYRNFDVGHATTRPKSNNNNAHNSMSLYHTYCNHIDHYFIPDEVHTGWRQIYYPWSKFMRAITADKIVHQSSQKMYAKNRRKNDI